MRRAALTTVTSIMKRVTGNDAVDHRLHRAPKIAHPVTFRLLGQSIFRSANQEGASGEQGRRQGVTMDTD